VVKNIFFLPAIAAIQNPAQKKFIVAGPAPRPQHAGRISRARQWFLIPGS
jgi:hypothetical protein